MINVYTIVYDNASFLELQWQCFKKHYDMGKFCIIDNSLTPTIRGEIETFAHHRGCYVIPVTHPRFDNGGLSHQRALQTALDHMEGVAVICDPDVFVLKPLLDDITQCDFAGLRQGTEKVKYLWPGFIVINTNSLLEKLDLRGAIINPNDLNDFIVPDPAEGWTWEQYPDQVKTRITTDTGGLLCRYIEKYNPKVTEFSLAFEQELCYDGIIPVHLVPLYRDEFHFWVIGGSVLHSARLSNWDHRPSDEVAAKSELVRDIVRHYIDCS